MVPITRGSHREQPVVLLINGQIILNCGICATGGVTLFWSQIYWQSIFLRFIWPDIVIGENIQRAQVPL